MSLRIVSCAKLEPQYFGPFEILERIGKMDYLLSLPPKMKVHDVFYVSLIKIYVKYFYHVIDWFILFVETKGDFHLEPQLILQRNMLMLWNRLIE